MSLTPLVKTKVNRGSQKVRHPLDKASKRKKKILNISEYFINGRLMVYANKTYTYIVSWQNVKNKVLNIVNAELSKQ